jgi:rfaE bifunctional protein nucleotidyltransferase chain/domain/rfaE bifunctional protein kinase chain/domain
MTLVVVGDSLLDRDLCGRVERLCPDAPVPVVDDPVGCTRPGGAALAAALAAGDGRAVVLVTALGRDGAGAELAELLDEHRVEVVDVGLGGPTPEKVRVRADGRSLVRLDYGGGSGPGGGGAVGRLTGAARRALAGASAVLVADYGRGMAAAPDVRAALGALCDLRPGRVPLVWDPHPRGAEPVPGTVLATPNRSEAARFTGLPAATSLGDVVAQGRALCRRWSSAVAITMGEEGAVLVPAETTAPLAVPAARTALADPCGAGDRFASAAAGLLADGALVSEAVVGAVAAASSFVAVGGAAAFAVEAGPVLPDDPVALAAGIRAQGRTVVATGGCFDLLHAGHVHTLEAARGLGDCLIVCLNSDDSVRRLKGPGRPAVGEADRARLVGALGCVDAVAVFDEDTPVGLLERLRPHVFVKGGDYGLASLPEAAALAQWGGQAVVVPYLPGRSSTRLMKEAASRA